MPVIDTALDQIRQLHPYTPGKPVEELARELGIRDAIKLASNENPLGCSSSVAQVLAQAAEHLELYPDANAYYLKQDLAAKLGVAENQITIGNGSNDVLDLVARSFLQQGVESVYSQYAFMVYAMVSQACGASGRAVPALAPDSVSPYGHDLDAMLAAVGEDTGVVFIANPNNPTGGWLGREQLREFIEKVPEQVAVVVDEAYFEYVDLDDYPNALDWLGRFPNLIVTRTFSKIYGLAGLRLGYAVSSPELCDLFNRVRQPFNGNSLALAAARAALADDEFVARSRECNRHGLDLMRNWFDARGIDYIPSVGNFLTVRFGADCEMVNRELMQRGIIVRPIANYGLPEFLRISVGTEPQLEALFAALEDVL